MVLVTQYSKSICIIVIIATLLLIVSDGSAMLKARQDIIVKCPQCEAFYKQIDLISGNTYGAKRWSDGKVSAPMLAGSPNVVECQVCKEIFFIEYAKRVELNKYDASQRDSIVTKINKSEYAKEPDEEGYYKAISKKLATNIDDEKILRRLAWQRSNDVVRSIGINDSIPPFKYGNLREDNMLSLLKILDPKNVYDQINQAELLRELKRFEEAIVLLKSLEDRMKPKDVKKDTSYLSTMTIDQIMSPMLLPFIHQLRALCENHDYIVREIK